MISLVLFWFCFTGHKNSVSCVGFSHDGLYVASADLDGLIRVWHCEKKELAWSFDCGSDIMVHFYTAVNAFRFYVCCD